MRHYILLLLIVLTSCNNKTSITEEQQKEFEAIARTFQNNYMGGSDNCEQITKAFDENVKMSEINFGQPMNFTYDIIVAYCSHLPKKQIIETTTEQRLLTPTLGYDYVNQLYLRKSQGDTIRETSSKIWEKKNNNWKIIQINSSLNKSCD